MYKSHVESSSIIFSVLMFGFVFISTTYIFGTLLTANGNLKALNYMALSGMILNILLNLFLIPRYQALGSAIASLITQGFTALVQVIIAFRIFRFHFNFKLLILLLIFAVGVSLLGIITNDLPYRWSISMSIMIGLSFLLAFSIRVIKLKDLYQIIKNDK